MPAWLAACLLAVGLLAVGLLAVDLLAVCLLAVDLLAVGRLVWWPLGEGPGEQARRVMGDDRLRCGGLAA